MFTTIIIIAFIIWLIIEKRKNKNQSSNKKPKQSKKSSNQNNKLKLIIPLVLFAFVISLPFIVIFTDNDDNKKSDHQTTETIKDKSTHESSNESDNDSPSQEQPKNNKDQLKQDVESNLDGEASIKEVSYNHLDSGYEAVILLKGSESSSDNDSKEQAQLAMSKAVLAIKNSNVQVDNLTVGIQYPLQESNNVNSHAFMTDWNHNTLMNLNINTNTLSNNLETYANDFREKPFIWQ